MEYKDYYKILGVDKEADADEIKQAYRKLALKYHPDRNQGDKKAEETFKEINEAYQVLGDAEKRAHYDRLGSAYNNWQQGGAPGGFNWEQWMRGSGHGSAPGGVRVEYVDNLEDLFGFGGGSFSDFFNQVFGGLGGFGGLRQQASRSQPQQYETEMVISLQEAYNGSARQIKINERRFEVKVPKGASTGTKLRLKGAGPGGHDVYLSLKVTPDPRFERKGNRLYTDVVIDLYTAVLGGEVKVPTLSGDVMLKIPGGTQPGRSFRLKGRGMPDLKNPNQRGDLFVGIQIEIPDKLSAEQRRLFSQLAGMK